MGGKSKGPSVDEFAAQQIAETVNLDYERDNAKLRASNAEHKAKLKKALAALDARDREIAQLTEHLSRKPVKAAKRASVKDATNEGAAVSMCSDWHIEETVEPETVSGLNEHNLAISEQRQRVFESKTLTILEHERQLANITEWHVCLGGDFISGYIHDELKETCELAPLPASHEAASRLESMLRLWQKESGLPLYVHCVDGNHGRNTLKTRVATRAANSIEHSMYVGLALRFRDDPNVTFNVSQGYHCYVDILGHPVRFHHGDHIRYQGGVLGLAVPASKAIAAWNRTRYAKYDFFGHYHRFMWCDNWVCNGSLIGLSPYAVDVVKAEQQEPQQAFGVIDRGRGLTRVLPIFCA